MVGKQLMCHIRGKYVDFNPSTYLMKLYISKNFTKGKNLIKNSDKGKVYFTTTTKDYL